VTGAQFADLAAGAGDRVLMTLGAALRVVDGAEPVGDLVALLERRAIGVELRLCGEPVRQIVEPGRRLRGAALTLN